MPASRSQKFLALYIVLIALCAILFFALRDAEDPSRRSGRILSGDAGRIALSALRERDAKYDSYEVVHVAWARAGEGAPEPRWVVLLDRVPHTGLDEALIVELRGEDGSLLRVRQPVR